MVRSYVKSPTANDAKVKYPSLLVTVSRIEPVLSLRRCTLALGTTAPEGSDTMPVRVAKIDWPWASDPNSIQAITTHTNVLVVSARISILASRVEGLYTRVERRSMVSRLEFRAPNHNWVALLSEQICWCWRRGSNPHDQ